MVISKQKIKEYLTRYVDDAESIDEGEDEWCQQNITKLVDGDWVEDYKTCFCESIYKVGGTFYSATQAKSNSGAWGDPEWYDTEVCEVAPVEVTTVKYVPVKES
jgi:hypothetical protein